MAPPSAVPMNGKRIGKRNSWLSTSIAWPPTGKPVTAYRGPAWFSANPRSEVPPPAKNRSGSGITVGSVQVVDPTGQVGAGKVSDTVSRYGTRIPKRTERAKLNRRLIG